MPESLPSLCLTIRTPPLCLCVLVIWSLVASAVLWKSRKYTHTHTHTHTLGSDYINCHLYYPHLIAKKEKIESCLSKQLGKHALSDRVGYKQGSVLTPEWSCLRVCVCTQCIPRPLDFPERSKMPQRETKIHSSTSLGQIQVLWGLKFLWGGPL